MIILLISTIISSTHSTFTENHRLTVHHPWTIRNFYKPKYLSSTSRHLLPLKSFIRIRFHHFLSAEPFVLLDRHTWEECNHSFLHPSQRCLPRSISEHILLILHVTQGHICSDLNVQRGLSKWQKPPFSFTDPNSATRFTHRHFPRARSPTPHRQPNVPIPSTQLKLPVCDLLFLSVELTVLKGSSLLAPDVQGSRARQEGSSVV